MNRLAGPGQRQFDLHEVVLRDLSHFVVRERSEQHDLVDAVAEFGRKPPLQLPHDLILYLFDTDLAGEEAHRARQLPEVLRPDVRCHDNDRV